MITVSNVTVAFGGYVLLDGINLYLSRIRLAWWERTGPASPP